MMRFATAMVCVPALAGAEPYDGVYKQTANAECALVGVDGGALAIRDGIFTGVEVSCCMTKPVNVVDMDATLYTMQCTGEDTVWTERAMLMDDKQSDGLIMVRNGYAFRYDRCPEDAS